MGISEFQFQQLLARTTKGRESISPASAVDKREAEIHDEIEANARGRGWGIVHSRMDKPTTQAEGVPDFILIAPNETTFWIEVKRPGQKPKPAQLAFAAICRRHGHRYALVYSFAEYLEFVSRPDHPCNRSASPAGDAPSPLRYSPP